MAYTYLGTYSEMPVNIYGTALNNYYFKADVYIEQSITANTTKIKVVPKLGYTGGTGTSSTYYFSVMDSKDYHRLYIKLGHGVAEYEAPEIIKTIYHENDGTKRFTLSVTVENEHSEGANSNLNNYCMKRATINTNISLPTIPRASEFSVDGHKIGSKISIQISPYVSSFRHHVYYRFGSINWHATSGGAVATSCEFTPALSDANQIPNSIKGVCTIVVDTYNGSVLIGSKSKSFDLYVADSMYPSFDSLSLEGFDLMENSLYIAGRSNVTATIHGARGAYGSTITSYSIIGHALSTSSSSGMSGTLASGTHIYTATITDSRGRTATRTNTITVYTYVAPEISGVHFRRTNANGNDDDGGGCTKIDFNASVQNTGGANVNVKRYEIAWRYPNGDWNYGWKTGILDQYSQTISIPNSPGWDIAKSYEIMISIIDSLSTITANAFITTVKCIMNIEDGGIGIGKYHEKGTLDIGGNVYISDNAQIDGNLVAQRGITSGAGVSGTTFAQSNYGLPIEIGKYIDMHQIGSINDVDVRIEASDRRAIMIRCGNDLSQGTEIGRINNNASFIKNLNGGQFLTMEDGGRLAYDGATVPHNWRQNFTPFVYSDTGTFSSSDVVGQAVYLGDLIFVQGRIIASRGGHSGSVCIGGLPVSNAYNYPAVNFGFFGGVTGNLGNGGYDIRGYVQVGASHIILNYSNKDNNGWTALNCSHLTTGSVDINFSVIYRWR